MNRTTSSLCAVPAVVCLCLAACGDPDTKADDSARIDFEPGQLVSAEVCGTCHQDIYSFWKESIHAKAATGKVFLQAVDEAVSISGEDTRKVCMTCHSPAALASGNFDPSDPLNLEGVGCDFCHSLTGTHLDQPENPFVLEIGSVKFGPVKDAASTGHDVAYSEFHNSSLHCAGCHEYVGPNGIRLLSTYSEWKSYQKSGGKQTCQNCHMPLVLANVVDPKIKRVEHSFVNLHSMPGGHSRDQLSKSLRLRIIEMQRTSQGLSVKIKLSNTGAGHMVPTGSPSRKVILSLQVSPAQGDPYREERVYQRIIGDESGEPILRDSGLFLHSAQVLSDNRLAPLEERVEEYLVPVPDNQNLTIQASLTYVYSPHDRPDTEDRIEFFSERRRMVSNWAR